MNDITAEKIGNIYGFTGGNFAGTVYNSEKIAPALQCMQGGNSQPLIIESCAIRGRNPDNPSDRMPGILTEQRLELSGNPNISNCLTSVQKDSMVLESSDIVGSLYYNASEKFDRGIMPDVSRCIKTDGKNAILEASYRIRKLTPRESWRVMGMDDQDFDRAASIMSNTSLYKQAGNSIVKNVLMAIFGQLFEGKEDVYKHFP